MQYKEAALAKILNKTNTIIIYRCINTKNEKWTIWNAILLLGWLKVKYDFHRILNSGVNPLKYTAPRVSMFCSFKNSDSLSLSVIDIGTLTQILAQIMWPTDLAKVVYGWVRNAVCCSIGIHHFLFTCLSSFENWI